jgi:hypothetical protein
MMLIFAFLHSPWSTVCGAQEYVATFKNQDVTPEKALDLARARLASTDECVISTLIYDGGETRVGSTWVLKRHKKMVDLPEGCYFECLPAATTVVEDDMEVSVSLPPFVAVFQR